MLRFRSFVRLSLSIHRTSTRSAISGCSCFFRVNMPRRSPICVERSARENPISGRSRRCWAWLSGAQGNAQAARADLEASFPQLQDQKVRIEAGLELVELYNGTEELEKASSVVGNLRTLDAENQQVLYAAYRVRSDLAREAVLSLALVAPQSALMYQVMAHEAARGGRHRRRHSR